VTGGYADPAYAESLSEFGRPRRLEASGGSVLVRAIPGSNAQDAMGCYPLFACQDWSGLGEDLAALARDVVSIALVTDPFGAYDPASLRASFDPCFPFKEHRVADLRQPRDRAVSKHHAYYARRALRQVEVVAEEDPLRALDDWVALYEHLKARHALRGIKAFSRSAFARQLALPGTVLLRAIASGETVGAHVFFIEGDKAYSHLAATSPRGYELNASYAIHWHALEHLAARARWLDIGAGAGAAAEGKGLGWFKDGWSSATRTAWFCGRVLDPARYDEICRSKNAGPTRWFPAYRAGEL